MTNVAPSHLADTDLFDFRTLSSTQTTEEETLFDDDQAILSLMQADANATTLQFVRRRA